MDSGDVIRPIMLLMVALLIYHLPVFLHKVRLTFQGILYLLFCNDKSWKKTEDPLKYFSPLLSSAEGKSKLEKKTIIFVRHGESTWNETFNKGNHRSTAVFIIGFIPNLIKALLYEMYLLLTGQMDSWFYDSPLSPLGIDQIEKLNSFLSKDTSGAGMTSAEEELISILRGDAPNNSLVVSSSLRRALSTVAIAFQSRLDRNPKEKIHVIPSLQEISRNPDTLSITPPYEQVTPSWIDRNAPNSNFTDIFQNRTDMTQHAGNKPLNTNGYKRMSAFCKYAFSVPQSHIICGGHSIWFRSFFKSFLPFAIDHTAKKKKIVNGGCVAFTLLKVTNEGSAAGENDDDKFMIDPKSIVVVYGGF